METPKVIVAVDLLMKLFLICQIPGCGSAIDQESVLKTYNGACLTIRGNCNDGHDFIVSMTEQKT